MVKFIGFIPARMGSKRIPNKNLKLFRKKPLIFYSIDASKKSKYIPKIAFSIVVIGALSACVQL